MENQTFKLDGLTLDQVNKVLFGLSKLPYAEVYELILTINVQAKAQLQPEVEVVTESNESK